MKKMRYIIASMLVILTVFSACGAKSEQTPSTTSEQVSSEVKPPAGKYKEAPQLAQLVKEGKLPPVEQRLPEEPAISTAKEIGKYGGVYKGAAFGPKHGQLDTEALRFAGLLTIEPDLKTLKPYILKDYKISEDFKEYTFFLRKGMKWSNGDPLTADDFMFWYEDILMNKELTPSIPSDYRTGNDPMKMEKIDDYTVKVSFTQPNPSFEIVMAKNHGAVTRHFFAPKKYLQQWHIKYNSNATEQAKKEGFETWFQCFQFHSDNSQSAGDTNAPDVTPWVLTKIDEQGNKYFDRNPYYFVVDREGNQLPYIDQQVAVIVKDAQVRTLKLISGELHAAGENPLPVKDYTLYKENEQKGDYKVYLFKNTRGSDCAFAFNLTHKDPVMRKIFNEPRFKEALSYAINREEVNQVLYFGKAEIRQAVPPADTSFYEDWMGKYAIEYNVEKANAILDELGYKWDADKKVRLMPNGKPFNIVLEAIEEFVPMCEMVAEYWTKVGVATTLKQQERSFYRERGKANERDVQGFTFDSVAEFNLRSYAFGKMRPGGAGDDYEFMSLYTQWFNSNGTQGEEPPEYIKDLYAKCLKFSMLKPGSDEYIALGKEITTTVVKNMWNIGLSVAPRVIIISNKLGNTPTEGTFSADYAFWKPYKGDAWYFKK